MRIPDTAFWVLGVEWNREDGMALNPLLPGILRVHLAWGNVFSAHHITKCERGKGFEGVEMAVAHLTVNI